MLIAFSIGLVTGSFYTKILDVEAKYYNNSYTENTPSKTNENYLNAVLRFEEIEKLFAEEENKEKPSPQNWIKMNQIKVYDNQVILEIKNPEWAMFTDTNSMDPVLDSESNAIEIIPKSESDIEVGDIVAYQSKYKEGTVTHRVIEKNTDKEGTYFKIKGDNNQDADPGKIRFEQIKRVVVAVIY